MILLLKFGHLYDHGRIEAFNNAVGLRMVWRAEDVIEPEEMRHGTHQIVVEMGALICNESRTDAIDAKDLTI